MIHTYMPSNLSYTARNMLIGAVLLTAVVGTLVFGGFLASLAVMVGGGIIGLKYADKDPYVSGYGMHFPTKDQPNFAVEQVVQQPSKSFVRAEMQSRLASADQSKSI